jgi:hypothetical protein
MEKNKVEDRQVVQRVKGYDFTWGGKALHQGDSISKDLKYKSVET